MGIVGIVVILVGIMRSLAQGPGPPGILHCILSQCIVVQNLALCHVLITQYSFKEKIESPRNRYSVHSDINKFDVHGT